MPVKHKVYKNIPICQSGQINPQVFVPKHFFVPVAGRRGRGSHRRGGTFSSVCRRKGDGIRTIGTHSFDLFVIFGPGFVYGKFGRSDILVGKNDGKKYREMAHTIIALQGAVVRDETKRLAAPIDFALENDEHLAIVGMNGSGKTLLIETLIGNLYLLQGKSVYDFRSGNRSVCENVRLMTFRDAYGAGDRDYYYQQRWNASDRENMPTAAEELARIGCDPGRRKEVYERLGVEEWADRKVISLSSGELRKFHIVRTLLACPEVLIVESPFIGLDPRARRMLGDLFADLARNAGVRLVLSVASPEDVPDFVTHVYTVEDRRCGPKRTLAEFRSAEPFTRRKNDLRIRLKRSPVVLPVPTNPAGVSEEIVRMRNVTLRCDGHTLLDSVDWTIMRGEKWALGGGNGSGKSTLLSLICADNPQAYAQNIALFGRRRGTGESIWDIKKRIGYVSPEMHRSYLKNIPAIDIVASGFFDSVGLYIHPDDRQRDICAEWMDVFGIGHLRTRPFSKLSSGEQRLSLLARAFVKDPELLVLDEPLHGLDCCNKERARAVIDLFCRREGKTLIYVTHYEKELPDCIGRYKVLEAGRSDS